MATIDRMIAGMHHWAVSQIGSGYDGKNHYSHVSFEIDVTGSDTGVDYWKDLMPNTCWKCAGAFGTRNTGNTRFFWSCDENGNKKKVLCADGVARLLTLALTHSNRDFKVGKIFKYEEVMYQEGTAGYATGNHIHVEICEGHVKTKVRNSKGGYNLKNMLRADRVLFLLSTYTTLVKSGGLSWKKTDTVTVKTSDSSTDYEKFDATKVYGKKPKVFTTTCKDLRLRSYPKTGAIKKLLDKGTELNYYGNGYYVPNGNKKEVWYCVQIKGTSTEGYVYGGILDSGEAPYLDNANP